MEEKLEKIRKILAKAEHPSCPPHEAEALNEMAATLIAKYGVDMALLAERMPQSQRIVGDRVIAVEAPYARDKCQLLAKVALALRCQCVQRERSGPSGEREWSLHLFGHEADLARVELLYTSLLVQAAIGLVRDAGAAAPGEDLRAFRRSWLAGFAAAVGARLREAELLAEHTADNGAGRCVALVLADRSAEVAQAVQQHYPRLGNARRRQLSGSGFAHGRASGTRADLGRNLGGRSGRQLGA
ncbi:MAG: DUF2786 domain-containing protein [Sporichthyaceae bacterium]